MQEGFGNRPPEAALVTPILPMETGLATYAQRILSGTSDLVRWTVVYPSGGDPSLLPEGVSETVELDREGVPVSPGRIPRPRFHQLGNSPHCFPVHAMLLREGGTVVFHELVLHHMLRFCHLENGSVAEYRRELRFEHGPAADAIERELSRRMPAEEYDLLLKRYPLIGRAINSSDRIVCLNEWAASRLRSRAGRRPVVVVGHPLSPVNPAPPSEELVPGSPLIGMVGGNRPGRHLELVVRAVETLRTGRFTDAGLALVGSGYPGEESLPAFVRVTGRLEEDPYQGWIRRLDVVVDIRSPHCGETSGSLLEAMRAGVPAVVSAGGSFIHIPSDAVLRVPEDATAEALRAALEYLLRNPGLARAVGEAASRWASDVGSMERLRSDWRKLLEPGGTTDGPRVIRFPEQRARAAAWLGPGRGMEMDTDGAAVGWRFSGRCEIDLPDDAGPPILVTACGEGRIEGAGRSGRLREEAAVFELAGGPVVLEGRGMVTQVSWGDGTDG